MKRKEQETSKLNNCGNTACCSSAMIDEETTMMTTHIVAALATPTVKVIIPTSHPLPSDTSKSPLTSPMENMDILRLVVSFIGPKHYRFMAVISQSFHAAYKQEFPKDKTTKLSASNVECAKICWEEMKMLSTNQQYQMSSSAAAFGSVPAMQYLRSVHCKWDERTCALAAKNGHLNVLQWCRDNGCPWNKQTCTFAAENGHLDIFQYARENGCLWDEQTFANAARNGHLKILWVGVMSNVPQLQIECTKQFRCLLSYSMGNSIQAVIDLGVIPRFVELLQNDDDPALQSEVAWVLTYVTSGTTEQTKVVVDVGAVPVFVRLLMSSNNNVREEAVWALGNIAGDSLPYRDLVLQAGAMQPLLSLLHQNSKFRDAAWALSNFCGGKPPPDFNIVAPALPTLVRLIFSPDEEVSTQSCRALSYLSDGFREMIQAVVDCGVTRRLVELLSNPYPTVHAPALRSIQNIVTGNDLQIQCVISSNALPRLLALLSSPKHEIQKEACQTISTITGMWL